MAIAPLPFLRRRGPGAAAPPPRAWRHRGPGYRGPDDHPAGGGRLDARGADDFDAEAAELEDGGDDEPEPDDEEDGLPVVVEFVRPKGVERRRACASTGPWHEGQRSS